MIAVGVTLVMIFAARGVTAGDMSIGDLVLVNAFLLQLFIPWGSSVSSTGRSSMRWRTWI